MFIYSQMLLRRIFRKYSSGEVEKNEIGSSRFGLWPHSNNNNRGISLVAVVIVMLIAATLALLVASFMSSGNISAITDTQADQAFYIAQAGMEWYLENLENNNNWKSPPAVKTNQAFGAGLFSVTYANEDTRDIDVTSSGKVTGWDGNLIQRVITCHVNKQGQDMTTSLWQESL